MNNYHFHINVVLSLALQQWFVVCVCVVPVFGERRMQHSPWHRFQIGTEGREPSTHWTASPDTLLDPVETHGTSVPTHTQRVQKNWWFKVNYTCLWKACNTQQNMRSKHVRRDLRCAGGEYTMLPVCCQWSWTQVEPFLNQRTRGPARTPYCSARRWGGWKRSLVLRRGGRSYSLLQEQKVKTLGEEKRENEPWSSSPQTGELFGFQVWLQ